MSESGVSVEHLRALLALGRYEEVLPLAIRLLAEHPDDLMAIEALVVAQTNLGQTGEALDTAQRLVALAPEWAPSHLHRAIALRNRRRFREATESAERAVELGPADADLHVRTAELLLDRVELGITWADRPLLRRALLHIQTARELDPTSVGALHVLTRLRLRRRDWPGARAAAEAAVALEPASHRAHQAMGLVAQAKGDLGAAGDHFVQAGKLEPRDESSTQLLRRVGWIGPTATMAVVALVQLVWYAGRTGDAVGYALAGAIVVAIATMLLVVPKVRAARGLSPAAKRAREVDRQIRRVR
jgi:tetratricopeptide (TPR) repeat protein